LVIILESMVVPERWQPVTKIELGNSSSLLRSLQPLALTLSNSRQDVIGRSSSFTTDAVVNPYPPCKITTGSRMFSATNAIRLGVHDVIWQSSNGRQHRNRLYQAKPCQRLKLLTTNLPCRIYVHKMNRISGNLEFHIKSCFGYVPRYHLNNIFFSQNKVHLGYIRQ
jgi:hypothetical protein